MKHFYKLISLVALIAISMPHTLAEEWSYAWPNSSTSEKNDNYPGGFYNFGSSMDASITSIERTLNGRKWTAAFDAGTKLTYLAGSGQAVGSSGGFTENFELTSDAFTGKIKSIKVAARTKITGATVQTTVNGNVYPCSGEQAGSITTSGTTPVELTFTPSAEGPTEGVIKLKFTLPSANTVTYIRSITIEWEEATSSVATPVITPQGGTFDRPVTVSIAAADGSTILYTTDGSNPRTSGNQSATEYTGPFTISATAEVKAVAKAGEEFSAVAESSYIIRKSPELKFQKESFTIELLEEDLAFYDNPFNVSPIKFSSSNTNVAWADSYGHIYTYSVGEATIFATFAGDDTYLPQTISVPVTVIAKEPLAGLTITPDGGTFSDMTEVTVECTDPRAVTLWYQIGDKAATTDDLGLLEDYTIHPSTKMTLKLTESCVLTVQAVGQNVWSTPQTATYTINMPLKAKFAGGEAYERVYYNGFDSEEEANVWNRSSGSAWHLTAEAGGFRDVPAFSSINPASKYSLYHAYANTNDVAVVTSPDITVPKDAQVRFYALFNPIWIYDGNLQLYVCENVEGAQPEKIWDAFLSAQEAATDDIKWTQYSTALDKYAGKEVYFAFTYELTNGDNVVIDDFEVVTPADDSATITVKTGESVTFRDLSTGNPEEWSWQLPGADTETSTQQNPTATYGNPGVYSVTLTVTKGGESDTSTRTDYVTVQGTAPTAAIGIPSGVYYSPEAGIVVPLNTDLTFTSMSEGQLESYLWTLPGTDLKSSEDRDVTVKYTEEGTFDIDLSVTNEAGTSATYLHGVKAGGKSHAWNISALENGDLGQISLGWYGNYGGTNWLDMDAFAEKFERPATPVTISGVNIYFAKATAVTTNAEITVSVTAADENGLPGETLATTKLSVGQLVDASETYNDPTVFTFETPVKVDKDFFISISGFPNNSAQDGEDNIAMYALRRGNGGNNTAYHLLKETDANYQPTGEVKWYAQEEDPTSFAIAPLIEFHNPLSGITATEVESESGPVIYYNLQGIRIDAENLTPGIYIRRQGNTATKVRI